MRNQNFLFVTFCLLLAIGMLQFRHVFSQTYSDERVLRQELQSSREQVEKEKMRTISALNQVRDLTQEVANIDVPEVNRTGEWVRSLRVPASTRQVELSSLVFEEASAAFNRGKYVESAKLFQEMIEKYPASRKSVEARFLLAESFFRANRLPECLDQIDEMINQYPDNKLTGYVMLRMAQIFKAKNQLEKTSEIYRLVIRNFSGERALVAQAEDLLKKAEKP